MAVEAVVDDEELVVVVPVEALLLPHVMEAHQSLLHPRPEHLHHAGVDSAGVVEDEVRPPVTAE